MRDSTPAANARWSVRLGAAATAVVALGSAVLSWDALAWGAGQLGVDGRLTWLYPLVIDGTIVVGTITALALRGSLFRIRTYVWTLLGGAIVASVVGNGAHAASGSWVHVVGAAVPAVALAASLHLLVILVRHAPSPVPTPIPAATGIRRPAGQRLVDGEQREDGGADDAPGGVRNPQAHVPARAEVRRLLARQQGDLTDADVRRLAERVAERSGVSVPRARRLLREERGSNDGRRPHLVVEAAEPAAAAELEA